MPTIHKLEEMPTTTISQRVTTSWLLRQYAQARPDLDATAIQMAVTASTGRVMNSGFARRVVVEYREATPAEKLKMLEAKHQGELWSIYHGNAVVRTDSTPFPDSETRVKTIQQLIHELINVHGLGGIG